MTIEDFGTLEDGRTVERITLTTGRLTVRILTLGAILQDVRLTGVPYSLTLGREEAAPYAGPLATFGGLIGPVANRIAGGEAEIDGEAFRFDKNQAGRHTLHSGGAGTHYRLWALEEASDDQATLSLDLPEGEGGFPGNRRITARYSVEGAALTLDITGATDRPTFLNLANHSYWNLEGGGTTGGHTLRIAADGVLEIDDDILPTGRVMDVDGTRFDFREAKPLPCSDTARLDHNFCLADARRPLSFAAELRGRNGIAMTMETTEPGLQVYDGMGLGGPARAGGELAPFGAVALEAQFWPDAPHHPAFPSIRLDPGDTWQQVTRWTFRAPE